MLRKIIYFIILLGLGNGCREMDGPPQAVTETDERLSGGQNGTSLDLGENAFGAQIDGLSAQEDGQFVVGNSFFRANWVTAPASVQSLDGLGPMFNAISCGSCHFKDGRAQPPATLSAPLNGLLFRLSIPGTDDYGGPLPEPIYGSQLQDKGILNVLIEGKVSVAYEAIADMYPDAEPFALRRPIYQFEGLNYGPMATGWMYSPRIAQQLPGLGLLEIVPEGDLLQFSDEFDANLDGISGRPNYVWDVEKNAVVMGRFGWKANQPNLKQQTAGAFGGDIGITTGLLPTSHLTVFQQQQYPNLPNGGNPELPNNLFDQVVTYMRALAVPVRRQYDDPVVLRGKYLFGELNCAGCHRPQLQTGDNGPINALHNQKIWPYTDLLLHDMGDALADNRPDYLATGLEWRTPPLWGIGLLMTVNGHQSLLHDGRARNVEEAILWHGGEAQRAQTGFRNLTKEDRAALIDFVNSL